MSCVQTHTWALGKMTHGAWSALVFHGRTICYEIAGDHIQARELGTPLPLEVSPELRAAIAADQSRQAAKASEP